MKNIKDFIKVEDVDFLQLIQENDCKKLVCVRNLRIISGIDLKTAIEIIDREFVRLKIKENTENDRSSNIGFFSVLTLLISFLVVATTDDRNTITFVFAMVFIVSLLIFCVYLFRSQLKKQENLQKHYEFQQQQKGFQVENRIDLELKQKEIWDGLSLEIEKYIKTTHATFLITYGMREFMIALLEKTYSNKALNINTPLSEEFMDMFVKYNNDELSVFLGLMLKKGYSINGIEKQFTDFFIDTTYKYNYDLFIEKYLSEFNNINSDKLLIEKCFDLFGEEEIYQTNVCGFILEYIKVNKLISNINIQNISGSIENIISKYKHEIKIQKMQERIDGKITYSPKIEDIDKLSGEDFEIFLKELFIKMAYRVELTKSTGDQGVDLILSKNNEITVVQAKCYSSTVGNSAIQEVTAGRQHYNANKAIVVTNNYFTKSAIELAQSTGTILWDRDKLKDMMDLLL